MNASETCCSTNCQSPGTMPSSNNEYFWTCCLVVSRRLRGGGKSPAEVVRHVSNDDVLRFLVPDCRYVGAGRANKSEHHPGGRREAQDVQDVSKQLTRRTQCVRFSGLAQSRRGGFGHTHIPRCSMLCTQQAGAGRGCKSIGLKDAEALSTVERRRCTNSMECWIVAENDLLHLRRFSLNQPGGS
ncbi:uncharacterized protein CLUP02_09379 [Colletotrichum lupini]|uniref:Uncharacterized protein n=1 Tax=Colletotrichum lupini TaxID=145971 RepID=A0A9Q8SVA9_9PEZI|nr:uncharacterized protein CLUP02_09379 [Colletotrichum lupini]UQC83883.1 hypothetical protein CLUP02_09379 [Colletotrichum lupini]